MITLHTTLTVTRNPGLLESIHSLDSGNARKELHDAGAQTFAEALRIHIRRYAADHHDSADKVNNGPAKRTGHLEAAKVTLGEASEQAGEVHVASPGFRRAFGEITIRPRVKKSLTIAIDAMSYGRSVAELKSDSIPIFRPKGKDYLATNFNGTLRVLYLLRKEVTLKHDPTLMPTEEEQQESVKSGMLNMIRFVLAKRSAAA